MPRKLGIENFGISMSNLLLIFGDKLLSIKGKGGSPDLSAQELPPYIKLI
jgi:hypothetical protein